MSGRELAVVGAANPEPAATVAAATVAAGPPPGAEHRGKLGQRGMVCALLVTLIVADQVAKWWAWRHVTGAKINAGGDVLVGTTIGRWYANPATGALLDLLDFGLLSVATAVLLRRPRPGAVLVPGTLMLGGWSSNLLDRLGLHYWTAPGSVRGVVDFIGVGRAAYNVADFFIVGATPLFLLAVCCLGLRTATRPAMARAVPPGAGRRLRARLSIPALVGTVPIALAVTVGATHDGGVRTGSAHISTKQAGGQDHHGRVAAGRGWVSARPPA
jgi:lipoprotein signal peptidase